MHEVDCKMFVERLGNMAVGLASWVARALAWFEAQNGFDNVPRMVFNDTRMWQHEAAG